MKRSLHQEKNSLDNEGSLEQLDENQQEDSTETRQSKLQKKQEEEQAIAEKKRLREQMRRDVMAYKEKIFRSDIYHDDNYQYRHVKLPPEISQYLPDYKDRKILLREYEYRQLGVDISSGWQHYMIYQPEPNILLLRRSHEDAKKLEELMRKQQEAEEKKKTQEAEEKKKTQESTEQQKDGTSNRRRLPKSTRSTVPSDPQKSRAD